MIPLTDREHAVLVRVADGSSYRDLAREWGIEEITVRGYGHRLVAKLGAQSIAHAVMLACRAGLLDGRRQRHGDHSGFNAHKKRGEDPCDDCIEGERTFQRERSRARRAARKPQAPASRSHSPKASRVA